MEEEDLGNRIDFLIFLKKVRPNISLIHRILSKLTMKIMCEVVVSANLLRLIDNFKDYLTKSN